MVLRRAFEECRLRNSGALLIAVSAAGISVLSISFDRALQRFSRSPDFREVGECQNFETIQYPRGDAHPYEASRLTRANDDGRRDVLAQSVSHRAEVGDRLFAEIRPNSIFSRSACNVIGQNLFSLLNHMHSQNCVPIST